MSGLIYGIIILLFLVYIFWTWNNAKCFEGIFTRISYIIIGTLFITLVTFIIFLISKNGVIYPHEEMMGKIRNIILLIFVPINGFLTLPQIANTIKRIKNDDITGEKLKKRLAIFAIAMIFIIVFEVYYFKNIQSGVIRQINLR